MGFPSKVSHGLDTFRWGMPLYAMARHGLRCGSWMPSSKSGDHRRENIEMSVVHVVHRCPCRKWFIYINIYIWCFLGNGLMIIPRLVDWVDLRIFCGCLTTPGAVLKHHWHNHGIGWWENLQVRKTLYVMVKIMVSCTVDFPLNQSIDISIRPWNVLVMKLAVSCWRQLWRVVANHAGATPNDSDTVVVRWIVGALVRAANAANTQK